MRDAVVDAARDGVRVVVRNGVLGALPGRPHRKLYAPQTLFASTTLCTHVLIATSPVDGVVLVFVVADEHLIIQTIGQCVNLCHIRREIK